MSTTMEQFATMHVASRAENATMRRNNLKALIGLVVLFIIAAVLLRIGVATVDNFFDQLLNPTTAHNSYTSTR